MLRVVSVVISVSSALELVVGTRVCKNKRGGRGGRSHKHLAGHKEATQPKLATLILSLHAEGKEKA